MSLLHKEAFYLGHWFLLQPTGDDKANQGAVAKRNQSAAQQNRLCSLYDPFVILTGPSRSIHGLAGQHQHAIQILRCHGADDEGHAPARAARNTSASERRR
jgi:hypothetical protein